MSITHLKSDIVIRPEKQRDGIPTNSATIDSTMDSRLKDVILYPMAFEECSVSLMCSDVTTYLSNGQIGLPSLEEQIRHRREETSVARTLRPMFLESGERQSTASLC